MFLEKSLEEKFKIFARTIIEANRRFNLTGFKTEDEIYNKLIMGSLIPVRNLHILTETTFIDLGSGAGIPGIPLGMYFQQMNGLLIESNSKKADFIQGVIDDLCVINLKVKCGRAEDIIWERGFRECCDWVFARAFHNIYTAIEFGAPYLRISGHMYIYSDRNVLDLPEEIIRHAERVGIRFISHDIYVKYGIEKGLLLSKYDHTSDTYPRRFPVVKREARRIKWE